MPAVTFVGSHAQLGGSEIYLQNLLSHLPDETIREVILLQDGPFKEVASGLGIPVRIIPTGRGLASALRPAVALRSRLRHTSPDVVHANGVKAAAVAGLAAIGTRIPVVWVKHDFTYDGTRARAIGRLCSKIVGVTGAVVETFGRSEKSTVVPTALPEHPSSDRVRARATLSGLCSAAEQTAFVGMVGRLHPIKGHLDLVEAAAKIAAGGRDVRVVMIGGAEWSIPEFGDRVRDRIAELDVGDRIFLLGHRDDARSLMSGFDIAVIPTTPREGGERGEGFSLVALELMALGVPIVAYDAGGLPEVVGECARLVPTGDTAALAGAIEALVDDETERARLGDCGRRRAADRFSVDEMVTRMLAVYREVGESS